MLRSLSLWLVFVGFSVACEGLAQGYRNPDPESFPRPSREHDWDARELDWDDQEGPELPEYEDEEEPHRGDYDGVRPNGRGRSLESPTRGSTIQRRGDVVWPRHNRRDNNDEVTPNRGGRSISPSRESRPDSYQSRYRPADRELDYVPNGDHESNRPARRGLYDTDGRRRLPFSNPPSRREEEEYEPEEDYAPEEDFAPYEPGSSDRRPLPARTRVPAKTNDSTEQLQQRISERYLRPSTRAFVRVPLNTGLQLYNEVLTMIMQRHLDPPSVSRLVERGVEQVRMASRNRTFLQTVGVPAQAEWARSYHQSLASLSAQSPQSVPEAVQFAGQIAEMSQQFGIPPGPVMLEMITGAVSGLDRHSQFVLPELDQTGGLRNQEVVGIGVQIASRDEGIELLRVYRTSPAEQAGLVRGDLILAVDGQSMANRTIDEAVDRITGPSGSSVQVTVSRENGRPFEVSIVRQKIVVSSVSDVELIGESKQVGYLRLEKFAESSASELDQALWNLHQQGMKSLIIDLRGNPGGLLSTSIELSDRFLPSGTIVSTRGRNESDNSNEQANHEKTWKMPLVVLVDENSASASEIFAAAIQENRRGTIVGQTTYGKGTVQTLFPIGSTGYGLRLTTAKFYGPSGREIANVGVEPDVPVTESSSQSDRSLEIATQVAEQQLRPSR